MIDNFDSADIESKKRRENVYEESKQVLIFKCTSVNWISSPLKNAVRHFASLRFALTVAKV